MGPAPREDGVPVHRFDHIIIIAGVGVRGGRAGRGGAFDGLRTSEGDCGLWGGDRLGVPVLQLRGCYAGVLGRRVIVTSTNNSIRSDILGPSFNLWPLDQLPLRRFY